MALKLIPGVCVFLLALGLTLGWWLWSDLTGGAIGLFLAGCIAVPLYSLRNFLLRRSARASSSQGKLDAS